MALFLGALPLSLLAQVRRPDPVPTNPRKAGVLPKRRTEILIGGGFVTLSDSNATKATDVRRVAWIPSAGCA